MSVYRAMDTRMPFTALTFGGGGAEHTHYVCGYLGCDVRPFDPLLSALPDLTCVRGPPDGNGWITELFRRALAEGGSKRAGRETVLAKLSELMFVEVLRRHIESLPEESRGWLSGLRDAHVGEALRLIHARPAEPWTLDRLAKDVGLSRAVFAGRSPTISGSHRCSTLRGGAFNSRPVALSNPARASPRPARK